MNDPARKAKELSPTERLGEAMRSADVPVVYANGFAIGLTNADIVLLLSLNNRPIQAMHMSYTLAKTLHLKLSDVVAEFEKGVGRDILTTDQVDALKKGGDK